MHRLANAESDSPWRFLVALNGDVEADRRLLMQTRAEELESITNMIASSRASILYATSGNGKSSILNAGVIPFFRQRGYAVFQTRPRPAFCTSDPALAFKEGVLQQLQIPLFNSNELDALRQGIEQLTRKYEVLPGHNAGSAKLLLPKIDVLKDFAPTIADRLMESASGSLYEFVIGVQKLLPPRTQILFL
jgi:hypothetical protein